MLSMPPVLATARLRLREPAPSDAQAIFMFASDPTVARYMTWARHVDIDDSRDFLDDAAAGWASGEDYCWVVERERHIVGTVACLFSEHGAEIGYVLARSAWGIGLGQEAAQAVFDAARALDDIHRIWATCDPDNTASIRILEKLGMQREGRLKRWSDRPNHDACDAAPRDVFMYAWTR